MSRLLVSLGEPERLWLERRAAETGLPMAELVRQAVRQQQLAAEASLDEVLGATSGIWTKGDGLKYQRAIRSEW